MIKNVKFLRKAFFYNVIHTLNIKREKMRKIYIAILLNFDCMRH